MMDFLTSWITNIILFILLAVIVEMLLPQTSLQKYVKMVLGLLLIIIFLTPIFKLFSVDVNDLLNSANLGLTNENDFIENSLEKKKIEIQSEQHAYILEQTAVQLKELTEKELMNQFDYQFKNIEVRMSDSLESTDSIETILTNLDRIDVTLIDKKEEDHSVAPVEEVNVDLGKKEKEFDEVDTEPIAQFLAEKWGVDEGNVHITIEGGNGV